MSCPTPDKVAFNYRHTAENAIRMNRGYGGPTGCYLCRCTKWHLTTKKERW